MLHADLQAPSVFDLPGFAPELVQALTDAFEQGEGSTFQNSRAGIVEQTRFLLAALRAAAPRRVLETGTHKAHFCYLVRLACPDARIDTFGLDPESQRCVDLLNARLGPPLVTFHPGDSKATLAAFEAREPEETIDFAWVDGGHDLATCSRDLEHCARLRVPHVCVDDVRGEPQVARALQAFLATHREYEQVAFSRDQRGIAHLRRRAAGEGAT
ncbi:MAG: class I SAM-dependent methyltransferase [Planctomycetes bacterium]|nr:class I SAM-dependent methyltransferase [Planctomycetota bacterium]